MYFGEQGRIHAIKASCGPANSVWPQRFGNAKHNGRPAAPGKDCPCLTPLRLARGRGFQFYVRTTLGTTNSIAASEDNLAWRPMTNFVQTNITMHFTDPAATAYPTRFYRTKRL